MKVEDYTWQNGKHVPISHGLERRKSRFVLGPLPPGWLIACRKAGPDVILSPQAFSVQRETRLKPKTKNGLWQRNYLAKR